MFTHQPLPASVLHVDDSAKERAAFMAAFGSAFDLRSAPDANGAIGILDRGDIHVLVVAQDLPEMKGAAFLGLVRQKFPQVRCMLTMSRPDPQLIVQALNHGGVRHIINQPWDVAEVRKAVAAAVADHQAELDRTAFTARLIESNRQLEFALRQHLLS